MRDTALLTWGTRSGAGGGRMADVDEAGDANEVGEVTTGRAVPRPAEHPCPAWELGASRPGRSGLRRSWPLGLRRPWPLRLGLGPRRSWPLGLRRAAASRAATRSHDRGGGADTLDHDVRAVGHGTRAPGRGVHALGRAIRRLSPGPRPRSSAPFSAGAVRAAGAGPLSPVVLSVGLAVLASVEILVRADGLRGNLALALLLALCTTLPMGFVLAPERGAPVRGTAAIALTTACALALEPFRALTLAGAAAQLVTVHALGRAGTPLLSGLLVLPYVGLALAAAGDPADSTVRVVAVLVATLASAAAATGITRHVRTAAQAHSATERAFADTLLEHAARGERARIARELHDVVAHHISMIAVQAETARLTTQGLPADGATRLLAIGDTARAALTEMRRLLGVLREDADVGVTRRPQPGLRQLMELVDDSRDAAGTRTRLIVSGTVAPLDPGIEVTAYRIVQEALTNARRHAPGAAVDVELRYGTDDLELRVRDNGPGPGPGSGPGHPAHPTELADPAHRDRVGHGLLGMHERAATVGGTLRTGPAPGGGFLVEARLPVRAEALA
ncbi:histidine kinase [Streptomyces phaeochromogenes]|uniref:sensor histidine kinase n=1 Tax=Streptomyces phaeochromogenes TaxID=1923 RepID=UPI002E27DB6F|nr:histidine kinase [Streptomyces phaeochromogenes]